MKRVLVLAVVLSLLLIVAMTTTACLAADEGLSVAAGLKSQGVVGNLSYTNGSNHAFNAVSLTYAKGAGPDCDWESRGGGPVYDHDGATSTRDTRWALTTGKRKDLSDKISGYAGIGIGTSQQEGTRIVVELSARHKLGAKGFAEAAYIQRFGGWDQSEVSVRLGLKFN